MSGSSTMKAIVIREPGGPEVLKVESLPLPKPTSDQVLIRVKAFGLNRSELFTRQGHSGPAVQFPRVLGIEATGIVEDAPGGEFKKGDVVITAMGGMGRSFDGGYAEFTVVPSNQVVLIQTESQGVDWALLGALPETYQTAYGALTKSLKIQKGDRLLVRGGTSSVGLAATSLARTRFGLEHIGSTSRKSDPETVELLKTFGASETYVEDGNLAEQTKANKFDKVLELVGVTTLKDSLKSTKEQGIVCMAGVVGNEWEFKSAFSPMEAIPVSVALTTYGGGVDDVKKTPLKELWEQAKEGKIKVPVGKVYNGLESIVEAHECMENSAAKGKIV